MFILIKMEVEKRQKVGELKTLDFVKSQENPRDFLTESVLFGFVAGAFAVYSTWFWVSLI